MKQFEILNNVMESETISKNETCPKSRMGRVIFFTLLLGLIVCNFRLNAQAWPPTGMTGNGTSNSPWEITTAAHLSALAEFTNANGGLATGGVYYKLMNDIDLSGYSNWIPIGNNSSNSQYTRFGGDFNGNGKVIKNLKINRSGDRYIGLFGFIRRANIYNLGVENCSVNGKESVGGLVGETDENSKISNCYVTGSVSGTQNRVGGLVGFNFNCSISCCYASCSVSSQSSMIGGLVGRNHNATIYDSYATGNVSGSNSVGGLVGTNTTTIVRCYATGNVNGSSSIGGLVGANDSGTIRDCVAANANVSATATNYTNVNRIAGHTSYGTLSNNYALSSMVVQGPDGNVSIVDGSNLAGIGKEMITLKTLDFYYTTAGNWDIISPTSIWVIQENETLPFFRWQKNFVNNINTNIITFNYTIYPNPTNGIFFVECENFIKKEVKLYDMYGKEILTQNTSSKTEINISHLPNGIYNVCIFSEGIVIGSRKIMKLH